MRAPCAVDLDEQPASAESAGARERVAALERAVAARLPRLRRSEGRGKRGRTHRWTAHLGTSTPSRSSLRETTSEDSWSSPGSAPAGWSCSRSACTAAEASAGSVIVLWGSTMRTVRSSSSIRPRRASRHPRVVAGIEVRQQVDRREGSHRRRADGILERALQRGRDRAVVRGRAPEDGGLRRPSQPCRRRGRTRPHSRHRAEAAAAARDRSPRRPARRVSRSCRVAARTPIVKWMDVPPCATAEWIHPRGRYRTSPGSKTASIRGARLACSATASR